MNRVVDKIFAWVDRNRAETEALAEERLKQQVIQTIEAAKRKGKLPSVRKLMTQVRQKRKREQWKKKMVLQKQKGILLEALMDPFVRDELLNHNPQAVRDLAEERKTRKYRRFFLRWKHKVFGDRASHSSPQEMADVVHSAQAHHGSVVANPPKPQPMPKVVHMSTEI